MRNRLSYIRDQAAFAATEFSLLFPIIMTLMVGVFDMGYAILAAQKTIRASQVTADLIARHKEVSPADIQEAVSGGRLALVPFDTSGYGYDIISIEFDENNQAMMPPLWRETGGNMTANDNFVNSLAGLGQEGDGLIVVQVRYEYEPMFGGYLFGTMDFTEIAFLKPRNSSTIPEDS
ncbi:MAG TPA: TadE/TadG family type IV pilus assembly protein [Alphaproteobacteria bacterium]|nr:TadE/TadG family type IV pilus assembly protein [Alphaproteobacteria bacterium]